MSLFKSDGQNGINLGLTGKEVSTLLINKGINEGTSRYCAFTSAVIIGSDGPRYRIQQTLLDSRGLCIRIISVTHFTITDNNPNR